MNTLKKISIALMLCTMFFLPILAFAQDQSSGSINPTSSGSINPTNSVVTPIVIPNPLQASGGNDFISFLNAILTNIIMPIAAVAVVCYIIWAGFMYVVAQGNEKKIKEAHDRLLWALIGAGILLGASAISQVVVTTINSIIGKS